MSDVDDFVRGVNTQGDVVQGLVVGKAAGKLVVIEFPGDNVKGRVWERVSVIAENNVRASGRLIAVEEHEEDA